MALRTDPSPPPPPWTDAAREAAFGHWLASLDAALGLRADTVQLASADASFRRYFRVQAAGRTLIVMDAPPSHEDCRPFVKLARLLVAGGVNAPQVLAWDEALGFMLLTDFGPHTLLSSLHPHAEHWTPEDVADRSRYAVVLDELLRLQALPAQGEVPAFDDALLQRELDLFPQWYVTALRGQTLDEAATAQLARDFELIKQQVRSQPCVLVHRDFHSRNLMVDPADVNARPGVIDFQDAVWGPITYDLVSLLRDAYVNWDEPTQIDHAVRYWEKARRAGLPVREDFGEFWRDVEWTGLQRHLKILGIFARLALRDGKTQYLADIPLVWTYAHRVCSRYSGLGALGRLLEQAEAAHGGTQTTVGFTF